MVGQGKQKLLFDGWRDNATFLHGNGHRVRILQIQVSNFSISNAGIRVEIDDKEVVFPSASQNLNSEVSNI